MIRNSKNAFLPPIQAVRAALKITEGELDGSRKILISRGFLRFLLQLAAERVEFDAATYLTRNPDLENRFTAADEEGLREHFLTQGYFEGRSGQPDTFDATWYSDRYPDLADALGGDAKALAHHYWNQGVNEWRSPSAESEDDVRRWAAAICDT